MRTLARLVLRNDYWLVIPIAGLLYFPTQWMSAGFVAALCLYLCRWLAVGTPVPDSRANFPLLLLLTMTAIGFAISPVPDRAAITAGQVVASVTIFYVFVDHIRTSEDLGRAAAILVVLGIVFSVVAPFTVQWMPDKLFGFDAVYRAIWPRLPKETNPNILAGGIAPIVPVALALIGRKGTWGRLLGAVALAPTLAILVLLQSRGAWFGLAAGLGVWLVLAKRWTLPLIPLGLAALFAFNYYSGGPSFSQFVYGKIGTSSAETFAQRQDLWVQSFYLIRESPLAGIGLGAFPAVAPTSWPNTAANPGPIRNHAHNIFLQVALDTGIPGLAAFCVLIGMAGLAAWNAYRSEIERPIAIGILAALCIILVHGFGDVAVWGTAKSSVVLWILLGTSFGFEQLW